MEANKRYSQTVLKSFHLSTAALDVAKSSDNDVVVMLASEKHNYILCTLKKGKTVQVALDLMFSEGDDVSFSCIGGNVHLTGYLIPDENDFGYDGLGGEEEDDISDEEEAEVSPAKSGKAKKRSIEELIGEEIEEDSDDEDFDHEAGSGEESEGDLDDEEEEEDSEEEEEVVVPPAKVAKLDKKAAKKQQNGVVTPVVKEPKNKKEAAAAAQKNAASPKEQVLAGGLKIEDLRQGSGPDAKAGKKVKVYYTGRLKSNNKVFDSTQSGEGFKFLLGRGEVIRGWDVGVAGMKVGGKRRITCPPGMAYGAKGSPPVIPANATLVFDVELRGVN